MAILVINGISGTGKDTAREYIESLHGYTYIHPIQLLKNFFEVVYGCPNLHTVEGKDFKAEGAAATMQEIMVAQWELFKALDPYFSQRLMTKHLESIYQPGMNLIFTGIRNPLEVDFINGLPDDVYSIRLCRDVNRVEKSDRTEWLIASKFIQASTKSITLDNNGTKKQLYSALDSILSAWGIEGSADVSPLQGWEVA